MKSDCQYCYPIKVRGTYGTESKRKTWLCAKRLNGIFLKDWKCVGKSNKECPLYSTVEEEEK